ncbi:hypothetical protein [Nannocystis pusilla]|uniref:hypothetical protein n=1 Tax=Nannocystis pusilla TaxID=889268 RepID=UPI003B7A001D
MVYCEVVSLAVPGHWPEVVLVSGNSAVVQPWLSDSETMVVLVHSVSVSETMVVEVTGGPSVSEDQPGPAVVVAGPGPLVSRVVPCQVSQVPWDGSGNHRWCLCSRCPRRRACSRRCTPARSRRR